MFSFTLLLLLLGLLAVLLILYVTWTFIVIFVRQALSPLRHLPGPPSPSFFMGNLREMHDAENTNLVANWEKVYGSTFVYRGFIGGCRLMTTDPVAVTHILSRGYDYPKPDFVRDALASMAAGHSGLLTVEGDDHRRQRKILNPAFSSAHIKSLSPVFWEKATLLRKVWLDIIDSAMASVPSPSITARDPFSHAESSLASSSSVGLHRYIPNPFSSFRSSKSAPSDDLRRRTTVSTARTSPEKVHGVKVDVLSWFARTTLDIIGQAGFGYAFNALSTAASGLGDENELARAFGIIFSTARKFRVITILQAWFPVLRRFRRNSATEDAAHQTMRRIGLSLIEERLQQIVPQPPLIIPESRSLWRTDVKEGMEDMEHTKGRDLLSVLIRSSLASEPSQQLSTDEILCQISTFLAAGHETTSSALAWTLYALARAPHIQTKLRASLAALDIPSSPERTPTEDAFQQLFAHRYLDACVRESLRLHSPATSTMRVAAHDDLVPVSRPFADKTGRVCEHIRVSKGDIITIPMQAMNKSRAVWGERAEEYVPERWTEKADTGKGPEGTVWQEPEEQEGPPGGGASRSSAEKNEKAKERSTLKGLWGGILTFGSGHVVNGNRACIGYRFAINEIKVILYVLLRDIEFSIDPSIEIEKKVNVVTRPCVKSEPHMGNQMPLHLRRVPMDASRPSPPPPPPPSS